MCIAPEQSILFSNRDKFDLVVAYDESSATLGSNDSPLSVLIRLISEQTPQKMLKRMPMILAGGMEAWRRDFGDSEVIKGVFVPSEPRKTPFTDNQSPSSLPASPGSRNPFLMNGYTSQAPPSMVASSSSDPHQFGATQPRSDTNTTGFEPRSTNEHRPHFSLDQNPSHTRLVYHNYLTGIYTEFKRLGHPPRLHILIIYRTSAVWLVDLPYPVLAQILYRIPIVLIM